MRGVDDIGGEGGRRFGGGGGRSGAEEDNGAGRGPESRPVGRCCRISRAVSCASSERCSSVSLCSKLIRIVPGWSRSGASDLCPSSDDFRACGRFRGASGAFSPAFREWRYSSIHRWMIPRVRSTDNGWTVKISIRSLDSWPTYISVANKEIQAAPGSPPVQAVRTSVVATQVRGR